MRLLHKLGKRLAAIATIGAVTVVTTVTVASPASAAATWWWFKNTKTGKCLFDQTSGSALMRTCNSTSNYEMWDWLDDGASFKRLRNRATGECLTTDSKSSTNAVWTASCDLKTNGQYWQFGGDGSYLASRWSSWLRTNPGNAAVYAEEQYVTWDDWEKWNGYH